MSWTLADFLKNLRNRIDEPTPDFFSDEELTGYINDGILNLAKECKLENIFTSTLKNEKNVNLPSDCATVKKVFIDGVPLEFGSLEDYAKGKDIYFLWNNQLRFAKEKSGSLELYYYKNPKILVYPTDTTDISENYQSIPLFFALARCKEKDEELGLAGAFMQQFYQLKQEMSEELEEKVDYEGVYFIDTDWS